MPYGYSGIDERSKIRHLLGGISDPGLHPVTVKEAYDLDRKNGNTFWADAIAKEMKEVRIAFNILPDGHVAPNGYQKIPCRMVFGMELFHSFNDLPNIVLCRHCPNLLH